MFPNIPVFSCSRRTFFQISLVLEQILFEETDQEKRKKVEKLNIDESKDFIYHDLWEANRLLGLVG